MAKVLDLIASFAWFMRDKLRLPGTAEGIVVDVGSGHSPHFRAHILVDKHMDENNDRIGDFRRRSDRQLVLIAPAENLPFKDKSVGFLLASHLLEHLPNPEIAATEFSRVARAGYVECPSEWIERLFPFPSHLWYVSQMSGTLTFVAKEKDRDRSLEALLLERLPANRHLRALFRNHGLWTERLAWQGSINLRKIGAPYEAEPIASGPHGPNPPVAQAAIRLLSMLLSLAIKPRRLTDNEIIGAMCCPMCHGSLQVGPTEVVCATCLSHYSRTDYVIDFLAPFTAWKAGR